MEKIGIICEYNPLHNGHLYHLKKIKELYPDSLVILVLNGYFMQRGDISILTKEDKTNLALTYGVDIILELPTLFATQSADTFAYKAIFLLNMLKVDKIVFGSECNDAAKIKEIAKSLLTKENDQKIKEYLDEGINYPTALAKSLNTNFNYNSNDLLGISYVKAIMQINPEIEAITIKRTSDYLDLDSCDDIISAANIRGKLTNGDDISKYVPKDVINKIHKVDYNIYFKILKTIIIRSNNLNEYLDVDEGIEYRLKKVILKVDNLADLISNLKTKRYTYNRLNRMLIHILLGIKKEDATSPCDYLNILGFNQRGQIYLNSIKKDIPKNNINSKAHQVELQASLIYDTIMNTNTYQSELKQKPFIK